MDKIMYITRCETCRQPSVIYRRDGKYHKYCETCKAKNQLKLGAGQEIQSAYPDTHKVLLEGVLRRINPSFTAKPTVTYHSLILALIGVIDRDKVLMDAIKAELKQRQNDKQVCLSIKPKYLHHNE